MIMFSRRVFTGFVNISLLVASESPRPGHSVESVMATAQRSQTPTRPCGISWGPQVAHGNVSERHRRLLHSEQGGGVGGRDGEGFMWLLRWEHWEVLNAGPGRVGDGWAAVRGALSHGRLCPLQEGL